MADTDQPGTYLDVHTHYVAPWWFKQEGTEGAERHELISDLDALGALGGDGETVIRVLSASPEHLYGTAPVSDAPLRRHNESLAQTAADRSGLIAFGAIDAFGADAAAQVAHAVDDLGLTGIILDSVRQDAVVGDRSTWATFEAAAERGVPVFVHPVWTQDAPDLQARLGLPAAAWGRGYLNGLALLGVISSGLVLSFPNVKIVVTGLAAGSLWYAHDPVQRLRDELGFSPHLYFDTTSFHGPSIRYQVDVLGADRVVLGSDWPFHTDGTAEIAEATLASIGLSETQRQQVFSGNLRELLR
jgi:predicted TIM-barrel fold metal-dependent hydrolase